MKKREKINDRFGKYCLYLTVGLFFMSALASITSCGWLSKEFGKPEVDAGPLKTGEQLPDIPAPEDAEFQNDRSHHYVLPGGESRSAKLVYESPNSVDFLAEFYKKRMPLNWKASEHNLAGEGILRFYNKHETCSISFDEREEHTIVRIKISRRNTSG